MATAYTAQQQVIVAMRAVVLPQRNRQPTTSPVIEPMPVVV
jgi:hypothetical protein